MLPDNFKVVILSRHRSDTIGENTLRLIPWATVTVEESEVEAYSQVVPAEQILPHPAFETMPDIRNWLNDHFADAEFVIHVHDDLTRLRCLVGWRARYYWDVGLVAEVLERTAICARDAGAGLFGFGNIPGGAPHYDKFRPFRLNGYVRNVIGHVKGHGLRWDPAMMGHYDVDLGLQALLAHRIIWRDERWCFDDVRLGSNAGGFQGIRTQSGIAEGRRNLARKWQGHVLWRPRHDRRGGAPTTEATIVNVRRRDPSLRG